MDSLQDTDGLVGKCGWDRCPYRKSVKAQKHHVDNADGSGVVKQAIHFDITQGHEINKAVNSGGIEAGPRELGS
jgi:hypothetical protein